VPKQTQWAPIQRNILAEDEQYSNIPFFGDDVIDKDSAYIRNFTEEVNANSSLFREVDEKGFVSLVEYLSKYDCWTENNKSIILRAPSTELQREWGAASYKDRRLPGLVVFQAIASKYSDSGSVDELIKKYKSLTKEKPKNNFVVNIDAAEAGPRDSAVPVERALETYKTLMCRRCFLYDCPLHNDKPVESAVPRLVKEPEIPPPSSPCGPTCFLQPSAAKPSSSGGPDNSARFKSQLAQEVNPLSDITGSEQDAWTGSEVTLFRVLYNVFPNNWCDISRCMITKNCRQVCQFGKEENLDEILMKKPSNENEPTIKAKPKHKTKQSKLYKAHSSRGERENKRPFTPCHHPGQPCSEEVCKCIKDGNFCEKFCYCGVECVHRFPGCKCKSRCSTLLCACFKAGRECDPDICTKCLKPDLTFDPAASNCRNVMLQNQLGKKLLVAPSDIAGLGCFIGEEASKNDFIAEYVGEMISQVESDRRGKIYDKKKMSYMFNLNDEFCVDAARMGGKIRFANHSSKPNCNVKILLVNGDYRIGIYANKDIAVGEELFFNYGKEFHGHDIA